jgi:PAS domain S-box-containing protein
MRFSQMSESMNPLQILENIPEGVFAISQDCRITYFNQKAEEITGYTRQQAVGKTCYEVFRPEICQSTCSIKRSMTTGKESFDHQVNVLHRSNKPLSIRIQTSPLRDDGGAIVGGLQTFHLIDRPNEEVREELVLFELRKKIGRDRRLAQVLEILPDLAKGDSPVLLQGEPGTGKRLLAKAIHGLSERADGPFFHVSCKGRSEDSLTRELLGPDLDLDKEGTPRKKGLLERAHRGTIFMEGIEDLPYPLQVGFFRTMEKGVYLPVGAESSVELDIRLIASTQTDLGTKVKEGTFRENLFYCLNVFKVLVPPLRERKEDIPLLARDILWQMSLEAGKEVHDIDEEASLVLQDYPFPGNLTELRTILEEAYRAAGGKTLRKGDLPRSVIAQGKSEEASPEAQGQGTEAPQTGEKDAIQAALIRNQWSRKRAARELGMDRTTLWRKMKRMGLDYTTPPDKNTEEPTETG